MQQHVQDARRLVLRDKAWDSFAAHFGLLIPKGTASNQVRNYVRIKVEILWKGNPLSCVKTFGSRACKLCSKERMEILKLVRKHPEKAINRCNEICGACRHKPRFHRFATSQIASTDEPEEGERVLQDDPDQNTAPPFLFSPSDRDTFSDSRERTLLPETFGITRHEMIRECARAQDEIAPADSVEFEEDELNLPPPQDADLPLEEGLSREFEV